MKLIFRLYIITDDSSVLYGNKRTSEGVYVPYTYKDSTFLDIYTKTAFRLKNDSTDHKRPMKYWKKPLKVFFAENLSRNLKKDFKAFAGNTIGLIDSLSIDFVKKVEDSNIVIYTNDDYDYDSKVDKKQKGSYYMYWQGNKIDKVFIYIDNSHFFSDKLRLIEIQQLFVQALGHFQLIDNLPCDSYFSKCVSQRNELTVLDIELLKYHYDYGICKGTTLETFMAQHEKSKQILKDNPNNIMRFFHRYETER